MSPSPRHLLEQRRVITSLLRATLRPASTRATALPPLPAPSLRQTLPPPSDDLVRAFAHLVGGDPSRYRARLPPHLFPQWSLPAVLASLEGLPYPALRIVNAGCTLEQRMALPRGEELEVEAQLVSVDEGERRTLVSVSVMTGTHNAPRAVTAHFRMLVPLPRSRRSETSAREHPRLPMSARQLASWRLARHAGLDFAKVTGDLNPIHWLPPYARAMGFESVILHGFGSMAWGLEGLLGSVLVRDLDRLQVLDMSFLRPVTLPTRLGLYTWGEGELGLGVAPGGPALVVGSFRTR